MALWDSLHKARFTAILAPVSASLRICLWRAILIASVATISTVACTTPAPIPNQYNPIATPNPSINWTTVINNGLNFTTESVITYLSQINSTASVMSLTSYYASIPGQGSTTQGPAIFSYTSGIVITYDGLSIPRIKLTTNPTSPNQQILIVGALKANSFMAATILYYFIQLMQQISNNSSDPVHALMQQVDFVFVPLANPDGYTYAQSGIGPPYSSWTKSMAPSTNYVGVDLNRNFPVGSHSEPISLDGDTFPGSYPGSEAETQTIMSAFDPAQIIGVFNLEDGAARLIRPLTWTQLSPSNFETDLTYVSQIITQNIQAINGSSGLFYNAQQAAADSPHNGSLIDWFDVQTVPSFRMELASRFSEASPYQIDPAQVSLVAVDAWTALMSFTTYCLQWKLSN